ncbi:MAG: hypothetical protein M3P91_07525 [Actinomycetota bacterium]|nr:hypothetical protein [Actinomycetota bacterium]
MKAPAVLAGLGVALALRRRPAELGRVLLGGALVAGPAYLLAGPHVLDQLRRASRFVSLASPWRDVAGCWDPVMGEAASREAIGFLALGLAALLAGLLLHGLPVAPDSVSADARAGAAVALGYLFAAPYSLPWYDALGWALVALLPWSAYDGVLLARTVTLSLAYVPGLVVPLPERLTELTTEMRTEVAPQILIALTLACVALSLRPRPLRQPAQPSAPVRRSADARSGPTL